MGRLFFFWLECKKLEGRECILKSESLSSNQPHHTGLIFYRWRTWKEMADDLAKDTQLYKSYCRARHSNLWFKSWPSLLCYISPFYDFPYHLLCLGLCRHTQYMLTESNWLISLEIMVSFMLRACHSLISQLVLRSSRTT